MNWQERWPGKELLDAEDIPFADLVRNLEELNTINTWLGGHAITCRGLAKIIQRHPDCRHWHIAEIGSGGGDNLYAVHRFLQQKNISHILTGIDIKEECIRYAARQYEGRMPVQWQHCDYTDATWEQHPDIIFSSLFCHHFPDEALSGQLRWMSRESRKGFFINDLHRHPLAYHSIKMLTRLFSRSYLVRHDAPVSVQRGFLRSDWQHLLKTAGVKADVSWQWAFRYLVTCVHDA